MDPINLNLIRIDITLENTNMHTTNIHALYRVPREELARVTYTLQRDNEWEKKYGIKHK